MTRPTVGRIVHYVYGTPGGEYASECRAAIVTEVAEDTPYVVSLAVLNPTGMSFSRHVTHNEPAAPGTWHWPERTES